MYTGVSVTGLMRKYQNSISIEFIINYATSTSTCLSRPNAKPAPADDCHASDDDDLLITDI